MAVQAARQHRFKGDKCVNVGVIPYRYASLFNFPKLNFRIWLSRFTYKSYLLVAPALIRISDEKAPHFLCFVKLVRMIGGQYACLQLHMLPMDTEMLKLLSN